MTKVEPGPSDGSGDGNHLVKPKSRPVRRGREATIHDVARLAGVSSMTVSRVVNDTANVRAVLRGRVMAAIKELAYTTNLAARSTRSGVGGVRIGILYAHPSAAFLNEIMLGGLDQASKLGAQLLLENCKGLHSQKAAVTRLIKAGVDGVILPPPLCDSEPLVRMLTREKISVLALATAKPLSDVSAVRINDFQAALSLTRHLIKLGHMRIAFIKGDPTHTPTHARFDGFVAGMKEHGIDVDERLVLEGRFTYKCGLDAGRVLLSTDTRPTAIFASNDDMAAGVVAVAHGLGIAIPRDVSICGFDDTPVATTIWPQLTTVHQPIVEMGRTAVTSILERIRLKRGNSNDQVSQDVMNYRLIQRASTGPAPSGAVQMYSGPGDAPSR